jgi:hypothetical protein
MNKTKRAIVMIGIILSFSGCATARENLSHLDVEQTAQAFFDDLQKSDNQSAKCPRLILKSLRQAWRLSGMLIPDSSAKNLPRTPLLIYSSPSFHL